MPEGSRLLSPAAVGVALKSKWAWGEALKISLICCSCADALIMSILVGVARSIFSTTDVGVARNISILVGVALNISILVGVALSISAGALRRCNSAEVGVALNISACVGGGAPRSISAAEILCISAEVGVARNISAEGVAVAECLKNMSAEGVKDLWWAWLNFLVRFKEWY